jgi:hypothetical protein
MVLTCFALLMPAFSLVKAAAVLTLYLVSPSQRSPTIASKDAIRSFGGVFEPR